MRNAYKILAGKAIGNRLLVRNKHRYEDNIIMDLREIGWEDMNWILLVRGGDQWRELVNTVMTFSFHKRL
jgi:hypothetical protein